MLQEEVQGGTQAANSTPPKQGDGDEIAISKVRTSQERSLVVGKERVIVRDPDEFVTNVDTIPDDGIGRSAPPFISTA